MTARVFNFAPGPATLPLPVLQRVREEFLDFQGMGASVIEISHRGPEFVALLEETVALVRELMALPPNYRVLFMHGGARMQASAVPLNLMGLRPARKAHYVNTGLFAGRAAEEAEKFGQANIVATSEATGFDRIPPLPPDALDGDASYLYLVTNNTAVGTQWREFPDTGALPLVGDATSDFLSREVDITRFGLMFASAQKNLGPAALSVVIVREDLLGHALPITPTLLDYARAAKDNSLTNTINVFAIYVANLVLKWLKELGGVAAMEAINRRKAGLVHEVLDGSGFYRSPVLREHRSMMNVTFDLPTPELLEAFLAGARQEALHALRGHKIRGGVRASMYNAMPVEGAETLKAYMEEFERRNG